VYERYALYTLVGIVYVAIVLSAQWLIFSFIPMDSSVSLRLLTDIMIQLGQ
jgi:hypothetical protein